MNKTAKVNVTLSCASVLLCSRRGRCSTLQDTGTSWVLLTTLNSVKNWIYSVLDFLEFKKSIHPFTLVMFLWWVLAVTILNMYYYYQIYFLYRAIFSLYSDIKMFYTLILSPLYSGLDIMPQQSSTGVLGRSWCPVPWDSSLPAQPPLSIVTFFGLPRLCFPVGVHLRATFFRHPQHVFAPSDPARLDILCWWNKPCPEV